MVKGEVLSNLRLRYNSTAMLVLIHAFSMTTGAMKRLLLSYVADVMPFSWSWCQYSVLVTQCQRTLKRKLSLYLCVMLSVISQLRPRISLHSLIMLLTPPLWCVHFFFSSYCAPGKSIEKQPLSQLQHSYVPVPLNMSDFSFFYLQFTLNCPFNEGRSICLIVSCFFFLIV